MAPSSTSKASKKAAALARAKEWADGRRGENSPVNTPAKTAKASRDCPRPPKPTPKTTPATRSAKKAKKAATATKETAVETPVEQYRKTPSRQSRNEARERARKWSESKKSTPKSTKKTRLSIPSVVEANTVEDDLSVIDDFQTARATEVQTQTGATVDLDEIDRLVKDVGNVYQRLKNVASKAAETDAMDLD